MSSERGGTLVESLVATVLVALVLALGASLFASSTRVFSRETTRVFLHQDVSAAMHMVLDDLSIAGYRPDDLLANPAGPYAVLPPGEVFDGVQLSAALDEVDFRGDVDSDGTTERVCYRVLGDILTRAVTTVGSSCAAVWADPSDDEEEALLGGVQIFDLTFLAADRTVLTKAEVEASSAASVGLTLVVEEEAKGGTMVRSNRGETALRN